MGLKKPPYDVIIIGGGAAGLMCAAHLHKKRTLLLEKEATCAKKIRISGGGRCNITNVQVGLSNYLGNPAFISPALQNFDQKALLGWLEKRGLKPVIREGEFYFCKESSEEIISLLHKASRHIEKQTDAEVIEIVKTGEGFLVKTKNETYQSEKIIIATGGLSYPKIGANGSGYKFAKQFGHTVLVTKPALVGLTLQPNEFWMKNLSGISFDVQVDVGQKVCSGKMLFAHKGISGPAILDTSIYWDKGSVTIDFLPKFSAKKIFQNSNKNFSTIVPLPKRFVKAFLEAIGVEDKAMNRYEANELEILKTIKHYIFAPSGTFGYSKAEVTKGGIDTDEVDAQTMQSKKVDGLYFLGEVLDVTGELGGYNFQWAFSSAVLCANALHQR